MTPRLLISPCSRARNLRRVGLSLSRSSASATGFGCVARRSRAAGRGRQRTRGRSASGRRAASRCRPPQAPRSLWPDAAARQLGAAGHGAGDERLEALFAGVGGHVSPSIKSRRDSISLRSRSISRLSSASVGRYFTYLAAKICLFSFSTEYRTTVSFVSAQRKSRARRPALPPFEIAPAMLRCPVANRSEPDSPPAMWRISGIRPV